MFRERIRQAGQAGDIIDKYDNEMWCEIEK